MKYLRQLRSLLLHKWYFILAGRRVGLSLWVLLTHDSSKFSAVELVNYSHWFFGEKDKIGWARAWLHHLHHNKHHPAYWLLSWRGDAGFYDGVGERIADYVTVLPMPEAYVLEMIADWMAASKSYTGSWDISSWVNKEVPKMHMHSETKKRVFEILETL